MKTLTVLTAFAFLQVSTLLGQESSPPGSGNLRQLLQQGLFEEEATRDVGKAAAGYAAIIAEYETQRNFAAIALFRLAEIRTKQGNKTEAIALHQRLLAEFPKSEELGKLSRDRLAALGGSLPVAVAEVEAPTEAERKELIQLREIVRNSPDLIHASKDKLAPLARAAINGWLVAATFLLDHGADINQIVEDMSPLEGAAEWGHKSVVELLLARGADVNQKDRFGISALYAACTSNRLEVARVLLAHGANPNVVAIFSGELKGTPIHEAVALENLRLVQLLLSHKADPNLLNNSGNPPLVTAIARKNEAIVKELFASGADVNAGKDKYGTVLHQAAGPGGWPEIVPLLLEHGASVKALASVQNSNRTQQTPLHFAMAALDLVPSPRHTVPGRIRPVGVPIASGEVSSREELGRLYKLWDGLLAKGADINARDGFAWTPLHLAAERSNLPAKALAWLIERGADVSAKDNDGRTPLDLIDGVSRRVEIERQLYFRQWSEKNGIKLLIYGYARSSFAKPSLSFERTAESSGPPSISTILKSAFESLEGSWIASGSLEVIVYRAQEGGEFQEHARIPFAVSMSPIGISSLPLPVIQWGDIVVMEFVVPNGHVQSQVPKEYILDGVRPRKTLKQTGDAKQN